MRLNPEPDAWPFNQANAVLTRDADRDAHTGISAVEQVIAVIDIADIHVIAVVPVISPFAGPRIHKADPVTAVLKAGVSANGHEGEATNTKAMLRSKVSAVTILRDPIPVVAAALLPGAVIGLPVVRTVLLPGALPVALARWAAIVSAIVATIVPFWLDLTILGIPRLPLLLGHLSLHLLRLPVWLPLRLTPLLVAPGLLVRTAIRLLLVTLLPLCIGRRLLLMILLPRPVLLAGILPCMVLLVGRPVLPRQGRSDDAEKQRENGCADN